MDKKPTHEELQQRVKKLETEVLKGKRKEESLEESLRASELAWQTTFNAITGPVCLIDLDGKILRCNKVMVDFLGRPINEIIGSTCWELVHGTSSPIQGCPIVRMRETRRSESLELSVGDRVLYVSANPILGQDGNIARAVHTIIDMTKQKRTEEALWESQMEYRLLVETMNEGFTMVDENGVRTYANNKLSEMLGYELDEIVGFPATQHLDQTNKKIGKEQFRKRRKKDDCPYEITWTRKDGQKLSEVVSPKAIFDEKGNFRGSFSVITDVTKLKQTEQMLKESEKELGIKAESLKEVNAALRVLLKQRDEDNIRNRDVVTL